MYELYIHSISLAIHRDRSVSGGAGFEVAVRQRGAPADGIDNRLRNHKNHEKLRFFDPKLIFFQTSSKFHHGHVLVIPRPPRVRKRVHKPLKFLCNDDPVAWLRQKKLYKPQKIIKIMKNQDFST